MNRSMINLLNYLKLNILVSWNTAALAWLLPREDEEGVISSMIYKCTSELLRALPHLNET